MSQLIKPNQGGILENVTGYHWLVVIIASCGWLFDCMDQRIFILSRESALTELLGSSEAAQATIKQYIGYATTSMILGWATGGIIFGMMSDFSGIVEQAVRSSAMKMVRAVRRATGFFLSTPITLTLL